MIYKTLNTVAKNYENYSVLDPYPLDAQSIKYQAAAWQQCQEDHHFLLLLIKKPQTNHLNSLHVYRQFSAHTQAQTAATLLAPVKGW